MLKESIKGVLKIRKVDLPEFEDKLKVTQQRMTNLSYFLVSNKVARWKDVKLRGVWQALIDYRNEKTREKQKIHRLQDILRRYKLYHVWRKYARQTNFETQLMSKGKIDGAYILLKRFKNRLKGIDQVVSQIERDKLSSAEFQTFYQSMKKGRAEEVFKDMQELLDCTMKQF